MRVKLKLGPVICLLLLGFVRSAYANFDCPALGRYLDPTSDCLRYFYCFEQNGELVYLTFKCPDDQLYSVEETRCLTASNLECKEITGATPIPPDTEIEPIRDYQCNAEGKFVNDFDSFCKTYITCTRIEGHSYTMSLHYCPEGTIFSHIIFECVSDKEFQCPRSFENNTSSTHSQTSETSPSGGTTPTESSSVTQTKTTRTTEITPSSAGTTSEGETETTPPTSNSPTESSSATQPETTSDTEPSSTNYPNTTDREVPETTATNGPTPDESTTEETSVSTTDREVPETTATYDPTPEESTTEETSVNKTSSTIVTEETTPNPVFICTRTGRFPNAADPDCSSYILCAQYTNGTFVQQTHSCSNSVFDPDIGRCSLDYVCPGKITTTPIPATSVETNPSTTQSSTVTTSESETETTPSAGTSPTESSSVTQPDTTPATEITPSSTVTTSEGETETTPSAGTSPTESSSVTQPDTTPTTEITPSSTVTTSESETETTPSAGTSPTESSSVTQPDTTPETEITPSSTVTTNEGETETTPSAGTSPTELSSVTQSEATPIVTQPEEFECTRNGRYPNTGEVGCKSYLACKGSGPFTVEVIRCDGTEIYSPNHGRCVLPHEYICPDATTTRTTETSTESQSTSENTENPGTSTTEFTTTDEPDTTTDLSSTTLIDISTYPPECMADPKIQFVCPDSGRYKDIDSVECQTYILCLRTVVGQLVYAKLNCETGTIYSEEAKNCVSQDIYTCPQ